MLNKYPLTKLPNRGLVGTWFKCCMDPNILSNLFDRDSEFMYRFQSMLANDWTTREHVAETNICVDIMIQK